MKLRSWLSTCSSTTCTATSAAPQPLSPLPKSPISDDNSWSEAQTSSTSDTSIQSNLSLLTLPSVPSLQKLSLSPLNPAAGKPSVTAAIQTTLKPHRPAAVNFLAVHHNLLYAAAGNEIIAYEIINNTLLDTFNARKISTAAVKSIAFAAGKIFTAHQDCRIRAWKINDQKHHNLIATLPTLEDRLKRFILPQNYVSVRRHKKKLWIEHHDAVSGLATANYLDNDAVFSISWDRSVKIWRAHDFKCLESINKAHDDAINAVVVSNDGLIYTGSADKRIKAWKKQGNEQGKEYELIATLEKHKSAVNALALNPDGSVLFSGSCDRSILVWEREDSANHMAVVGALRGHARAILCLISVHDLVMSGSGDRTVRVWRRGFDGRYCCLAVLDGHLTPVRSLAAVKEEEDGGGGGVKVFSGSFDGEIKVWKIEVTNVKGF